VRSRLSHLTALVVVLTLHGAAPASAQESEPSAPKRARQERASDSATAQRLKKFYEAYSAGRDDEARKRGDDLLRSPLSPFEIGRVEQVLASIDEKDQRWAEARRHLERAIASGGLNDQELDAARYQLVRLLLREERWQEAIDAWKRWAESPLASPGAAAYYELAVAHYQLQDLDGALGSARRAVEFSREPREPYLELLIGIRLQRSEYAEAAPLQKTLLAVAPLKGKNWVRLAAVDSQLGNDAEAAQAMQIAYYGGLLTEERDLRVLAQLLVQIGIPYRAGRILSSAIERKDITPDAGLYQFLAEAWIVGREYARAIEPLSAAATLSDTGNLHVRVAQLHAQLEDWNGAVRALQLALDKGRLQNPGDAYLLLGVALYRLDRSEDARRWLERSLEHPSSLPSAQGWLRLLDSETASESH
jgi:tetratricopeptide (TPR) repeat protein